MNKKNKKLVIALRVFAVLAFAALVSVVGVLAAQSVSFGGGVSVEYVSNKVVGSVTAQYKIADGELKNLGTGTASWDGDEATGVATSLCEKQTITGLSQEDNYITFIFTFTNGGANAYEGALSLPASVTDTMSGKKLENFDVAYKLNGATTTETTIEVPTTATSLNPVVYEVVYTIHDTDDNAKLIGTFNWELTAL
ncbi:MAG: hypothetical protein IJY90_03140 [Clostridia bacterium]|nr:hypothetical protein [Clostridia bacterium]